MEAAMAGVRAPLMVAWELIGEEKEKGKERRAGGGLAGGSQGGGPWGAWGEGLQKGRRCPWSSLFWSLCSLAMLREEERERKEERRKKERRKRKGRNRKKKYGKFSKLENF
jgi:hypothetical protein